MKMQSTIKSRRANIKLPETLYNNIMNIMQENNYPTLTNGVQNIVRAGISLYDKDPTVFRECVANFKHKN
jgi:metal-responsive CopG/Arc/MetJ family transcriptional regulator